MEEPPAPQKFQPPVQTGAPSPKAAPKPSEDSAVWRELVERCKGRLRPMYRAFLDKASGTLAGDILTVVCEDEVARPPAGQ